MMNDETPAGANPAEPVPANAQDEPMQENTEALLNSLIAECRQIVRVFSGDFMNCELDPQTRWKALDAMMELVKTGANVGDAVSRLRGGGETRHRIVVERKGGGEG